MSLGKTVDLSSSEAGSPCVGECQLGINERRKGLVEGRVFGELEFTGWWAQTGRSQSWGPTRRREVWQFSRLGGAGVGKGGQSRDNGWVDPGDEPAAGLLEMREEVVSQGGPFAADMHSGSTPLHKGN